MVGWALRHGDGYIETLVVYGLVTNPTTVAAELGPLPDDMSYLLSGRYALLSENAPALRLSSPGWIDLTPEGLIDINSTDLLFKLALEKIITRISSFSKNHRIFVERYFDFIQDQTKKLKQPDQNTEIFTRYDWVFSAWLPLTHARILLPEKFKKQEPCFAEFDIAFWTGKKLVCVQLKQSDSTVKSEREKRDYLKNNHHQIEIVSIPRDRLADKDMAFPADLFDKAFREFWSGLNLPQGPSPSPILMSPLN